MILQRFRLKAERMKKISSLDDLLTGQVADLYEVEQEQLKALPKLAAKISGGPIKQAINQHLLHMEEDAVLLKNIIKQAGAKTFKSGTYIIDEMTGRANKIVKNSTAGHIVETEAVLFILYINHFEIANIYMLTGLSNALRKRELTSLLEKLLSDKRETDYRLSKLSQEHISELHAV